MNRLLLSAVALAAGLVIAGCDCGKTGPVTPPCQDGTDSCNQRCLAEDASDAGIGADYCGEICGPTLPCPDTYYCGLGDVCWSDCATDRDEFCPSGTCSEDGRCDIDNLQEIDAGTNDDGGPTDCARSPVTETVTPNVLFVIDQSTSMDAEDFPGNTSRWDALRNVLIGTDPGTEFMPGSDRGLVGDLDAVVRFGVYLYSADDWEDDWSGATGTGVACPALSPFPDLDMNSVADPLLRNYWRIHHGTDGTDGYRVAGMIEDTPTGDSIHAILDQIQGTTLISGSDPTIIILATDGAPDTCRCPDNGDLADTDDCNPNVGLAPTDPMDTASEFAQRLSVESIQRGHTMGVETFVIAVADSSAIPQAHVNDLANAGVGNATGTTPAADSWRIDNGSVQELTDALLGIVSGQLSCTIDLQGIINDPSDGCAGGTVSLVDDQLNPTASQALNCNAACVGDPASCAGQYSWALINNQQVQLYGAACDDLLDGASPLKAVDASFPCSSIVIP